MLFKKELKIYLAMLRTKLNAFLTEALRMEDLVLLLNKYLFTSSLLPFLTQIKTKPTGFCLVPPLGPAIPVIETLILAFEILVKPFTIDKQHS